MDINCFVLEHLDTLSRTQRGGGDRLCLLVKASDCCALWFLHLSQ